MGRGNQDHIEYSLFRLSNRCPRGPAANFGVRRTPSEVWCCPACAKAITDWGNNKIWIIVIIITIGTIKAAPPSDKFGLEPLLSRGFKDHRGSSTGLMHAYPIGMCYISETCLHGNRRGTALIRPGPPGRASPHRRSLPRSLPCALASSIANSFSLATLPRCI